MPGGREKGESGEGMRADERNDGCGIGEGVETGVEGAGEDVLVESASNGHTDAGAGGAEGEISCCCYCLSGFG